MSSIVIENLVADGNLDPAVETWRISGPALIQLQNNVRTPMIAKPPFATLRGIRLEHGHDNRIEDTAIEGRPRDHGIYVSGEADTQFRLLPVRQAGYATTGSSGDGILVDGSSRTWRTAVVEGSFRYGLHPAVN